MDFDSNSKCSINFRKEKFKKASQSSPDTNYFSLEITTRKDTYFGWQKLLLTSKGAAQLKRQMIFRNKENRKRQKQQPVSKIWTKYPNKVMFHLNKIRASKFTTLFGTLLDTVYILAPQLFCQFETVLNCFMGRQGEVTCTVYSISAQIRPARKEPKHLKSKLRAYCPKGGFFQKV